MHKILAVIATVVSLIALAVNSGTVEAHPEQVSFPLRGETAINNGAAQLAVHVSQDQGKLNYRIFLDGITDGQVVWTKEFPLNREMYFTNGLAVNIDQSTISLTFPAQDGSSKCCRIAPTELQTFRWDGVDLSLLDDVVLFPLPETGLPKNRADQLVVRGSRLQEDMFSCPMYLDGVQGGRTLWSQEFPDDISVNLAKLDVESDHKNIYVSYEYPSKTVRVIQGIAWDGKTLTTVSGETEDPSSDAVDLYKEIAVNGTRDQFQKAVKEHKLEVMYPWNYFNSDYIAEIIAAVHQKALSDYHHDRLSEAIARLDLGLDCAEDLARLKYSAPQDSVRWVGLFASKDMELRPQQYIPAVNDYGYFLQKAGQDRSAATILRAVIKCDPKRTVAYLNLADSLWNLGDTKEAKSCYRQYLIRARREKRNSIPSRAVQRSV
jgi:hypothetical protein